MSELLAARELEKEYRGGPEVVRVLKGATLSVKQGEVVALVGASGVGKSTLLHLLGALDRPTAGQIFFDGEEVFARSESGLARFRSLKFVDIVEVNPEKDINNLTVKTAAKIVQTFSG